MQQWLTVHLNMTHPQHVIVQWSNRSSTAKLRSDDMQRSHLLIPQGHRDAADPWASVSNYGGYEEKKTMKGQKSLQQQENNLSSSCRRLKQSNEWARFRFLWISLLSETSVQRSGQLLRAQWKKYPHILYTGILLTLVVLNVVYHLLIAASNMSQSERAAGLAVSERLEKLSLNVN